jgi:hypothetical protein
MLRKVETRFWERRPCKYKSTPSFEVVGNSYESARSL